MSGRKEIVATRSWVLENAVSKVPEDFVANQTVGGVTAGDQFEKDTPLYDVIEAILIKLLPATLKKNPSVTISNSGDAAGTFEIGTSKIVILSSAYADGQYNSFEGSSVTTTVKNALCSIADRCADYYLNDVLIGTPDSFDHALAIYLKMNQGVTPAQGDIADFDGVLYEFDGTAWTVTQSGTADYILPARNFNSMLARFVEEKSYTPAQGDVAIYNSTNYYKYNGTAWELVSTTDPVDPDEGARTIILPYSLRQAYLYIDAKNTLKVSQPYEASIYVPKNSKGQAQSDIIIAAGTATSTQNIEFNMKYEMFYGSVDSIPQNPRTLTNADIPASFVANFSKTRFALYIPRIKQLTSAVTQNFETIQIVTTGTVASNKAKFTRQNVTVEDASGTSRNYYLYEYWNDAALNANVTLTIS